MDNVPFPIFYKNKEGIYSACNKAFSNYLGIEKSKIIGRTIYDILPLERAQYFSQQEQQLIFNKQDQIQEQQAVYADGSLHDVIFYRSSVSDSTEDIIGIVCTIIDISDRKRLEQVEKRLLSEMQALYQTMMDITRELDLPKLLRAIIERLIDLLGADGGELALYDQEEEKLTILVSFLEEQDRCGEKICLGEGYLGKAAAERKPFLIKDTTQEEGNECIQISKIPQAVLAAPLLSGQKLLGAVSVNVDSRTHVFDIQDIYIIEMFAYQAAVAIENANLYNEVQRLAITDELTGLSNRRALMEYAQNEFARTKRYRSSLSIIMFDLDRFKKLNDSYGHIAGDEVLRDIGKLCKAIFRNVDIIGRYGGEEFLVLLPETPLSEAVHTAERLRRAVEERRIPFKEHHLQVTISLGVAEYVTEDNSIDMLIDRVDQAMYRAKTMSRNTVST